VYFILVLARVEKSVVTDPGIGIQRSDSLDTKALFDGRKKIRIFKARIRIFVAR
jgi:hypothetical protein